jgi:hypothetical protein
MQHTAKSIRSFIGARDFEISKSFYKDLGFQESEISREMSYFNINDDLGFYLQNAHVKDWVDNTMLFVEVYDVEQYYEDLKNLDLPTKYSDVRLVPIRRDTWGAEFFLHDPSGILWHFGAFSNGNI